MFWSETQINNSSICIERQSSFLASCIRVVCNHMYTKLKIQLELREDIDPLSYEANDNLFLQNKGSDRSNRPRRLV